MASGLSDQETNKTLSPRLLLDHYFYSLSVRLQTSETDCSQHHATVENSREERVCYSLRSPEIIEYRDLEI